MAVEAAVDLAGMRVPAEVFFDFKKGALASRYRPNPTRCRLPYASCGPCAPTAIRDGSSDLSSRCDTVQPASTFLSRARPTVACYFAFGALLLDTYTHEEHIPQDEGSFRPVKVTAPLGSIFNPIAPVAAEARFCQIQRVVDLFIKALSPVLPDRCTAGNAATLSFAAFSGVRPNGEYWTFLEVNKAAMGGRPKSDGPDTEELLRNTRNNPLEDLGMHLPLICDRHELRDDVMPGAGKFRGGQGVVKSQRFFTPGFITHESDRHDDAPWGVFGGKPGAGGKYEIYNTIPRRRTRLPICERPGSR